MITASTTGPTELAGTDSYPGSVPLKRWDGHSSQFMRLAVHSFITRKKGYRQEAAGAITFPSRGSAGN
jgi:hypothetical protein